MLSYRGFLETRLVFGIFCYMVQSENNTGSGQGMLVVIDRGVVDCDRLAADAKPGAEVLMLDASQDAIAQITAALHHSLVPLVSLHIVVNASPGILHFAGGDFSLKTLGSYVDQLKAWFAHNLASPNPSSPKIFLYSDRLAKENASLELIDTLTWITGVAIITTTLHAESEQGMLTDPSSDQLAF